MKPYGIAIKVISDKTINYFSDMRLNDDMFFYETVGDASVFWQQ